VYLRVTGVRNAPRCNVDAAPEAHTLHRLLLAAMAASAWAEMGIPPITARTHRYGFRRVNGGRLHTPHRSRLMLVCASSPVGGLEMIRIFPCFGLSPY
jgi:hypothetical protein